MFTTNLTSVSLNNLPQGSNSAAFFKVDWLGETPATFNYSYEEGFGFPAVTGQIRFGVAFPDTTWTWDFTDVGMLLELHPVGSGYVPTIQWLSGTHLVVRLTPFSEGYLLDGTVQFSSAGSTCSISSYSGTVYVVGFAGNTAIGTFTATRQ